MRNIALAVFLAVAVFLPVIGGVGNVAEAKRALQIDNDSGEIVYALYAVSTNYKGGWGDDILESSNLPNNYYQIVYFPDHVRYVKVKAYFSGGRYKYWDSIDLDRVSHISITPHRG